MAGVTAGPARQRRLPSPGAARYGMVVLLLATAGLFAGHSVYNATRGPHWLTVVRGCAAGRPLDAVTDSATGTAYLSCVSAVEYQRAGYALAGALAVLLLGSVLMLLLPYRLIRRARPLRPADEAISARAAEAARRLGLRRPPVVLVGDWRLREPFTVRTLRGTRIIVPPGLRRLPPEQIDAVLRHEAAHVRAGDVMLVWLTRGMWWALVPALLLPPVLINAPHVLAYPAVLVEAPLRLLGILLGSAYYWNYLLRGLLLLVVAAVVAAAVLRSREHEADLAAAADGDAGLLALLVTGSSPAAGPWHRLRAIHPPPARRLAALADPHRTMELRVLDAAAAGLLIAMMIPVVHLALPADPETGMLRNSAHVTGLIAGTLLALVWGQAVWRAALVSERTGRPLRLRRSTAALAGAMAAGLLAHIAGLPVLGVGVFDNVITLIVVPGGTAAAVTLSAGLAREWARRTAGAAPARRVWPMVAVLNTLLFTGALWIAVDAFSMMWAARSAHPGDPYAWFAGLRQGLVYNAYNEAAAVTVGALGLLAVRWTGDRPAARGWFRTGVLVTAPAAAALAYRWLLLPPDTGDMQSMTRDFWAAAAAGTAVLAVVLARRGPAGLIPALAVAPAATLIVSAAMFLRYLPHWLHPGAAIHLYATMPTALLAPAILLAALVTAVFPTPSPRP